MDQSEINAKFMEAIRAKTVAALESQGAREKAIAVLLECLDATEEKPFNDKGTIIYSKQLKAHNHRLKAVELISSLLGLKAPDRHEVSAGKPIEEILAGIMAKRKGNKTE